MTDETEFWLLVLKKKHFHFRLSSVGCCFIWIRDKNFLSISIEWEDREKSRERSQWSNHIVCFETESSVMFVGQRWIALWIWFSLISLHQASVLNQERKMPAASFVWSRINRTQSLTFWLAGIIRIDEPNVDSLVSVCLAFEQCFLTGAKVVYIQQSFAIA